jgi:lysozyme
MNAPPQPQTGGKLGLVAVVGAACAAILVPLVSQWEGKSNEPYADIVNKMTVCFGETNVEMRRYTDAECEAMLGGSLTKYANGVLKCTPNLKSKPNALAAAISLSYNVGTAAYCRSTVDRRFDAGNVRGGCDALLMWNRAGGREVRGLTNRRKSERLICLRDA